ncbi:MAG: hypothetical protein SFU99_19265 [Saprospiraceae bacterium]|nr:hypothetical protein [Saprospiraceae bacterium]
MSTTAAKKKREKKQEIPEYLIYEMDEGKPIYYRGYKDVLNKKKTPEQIMGSSALQSLLVMLILDALKGKLSDDYLRLPAELGLKFADKSWRNLDIAIYDKRKVLDRSIFLINKYIDIPPEVVIEIDTKAELTESPDPASYFQRKTDQLLDAGVQRVIWIFTATQKHLVAVKDQKWEMDNWSADIAVMENIHINIAHLIDTF